VAVRYRDIRHIRASKAFVARALELNDEHPEPVEGVALDADADVVTTAGEHLGLVGLAGRRGDLRIGRVERASRTTIVMREVSTRGRWLYKPTRFKVKGIAAVVMGGRYMDRLAAVLAAARTAPVEAEDEAAEPDGALSPQERLAAQRAAFEPPPVGGPL
jgi:hypothetical protein